MTAGSSSIAVLLEHSLSGVWRNWKGRWQVAHALTGQGLQHPLGHQAINAVLQGQVSIVYRHDFAHRAAMIRYDHFIPLLNELQVSAEVDLRIPDPYAGISH
jgi:hypothetical protein